MRFFLFFFITFTMLPFTANAQDDSSIKPLPDFLNAPREEAVEAAPETLEDMVAPAEPKVKSGIDMSDIPYEFILEASNFGERCRNDEDMNLYFDCRCMGAEYLDKRIELGPEASSSEVQNALGITCKDGTGIAGQMYEYCLTDFINAPTELDPEEFCQCYGNSFAKYYEDLSGRLTIKAKIALMSRSRLVCRNPSTARRIYGNGNPP